MRSPSGESVELEGHTTLAMFERSADLCPDRFLTFTFLDAVSIRAIWALTFLRTVRHITMFYTGLDDQASMRRIFHILESSNFIPAIKGSGTWWLRKSTARATLWMHERRAWETERDEDLVRLNLLLTLLLQRLPPPPANDNNRDGSQDPLPVIVIEAAATVQRLLKVPAA
jgi:hypothetical protein